MKVIIPDAQSRKAFDIINILERVHGYELLLFAPPGTNRLLRAIYGQKVHPLRMENYGSFREDLLSATDEDSDNEYIWMTVSEDPTLYFYELMEKEPHQPIRYLLLTAQCLNWPGTRRNFRHFAKQMDYPFRLRFLLMI